MATFKILVQKHQERTDGKFPVSIRVTWKRDKAYIKSEYYVTRKQLTKTFELRDNHITKELLNRIAKYEEMKVKKLGDRINLYTAKELAAYFVTHDELRSDVDIDFIEFCGEKIRGTNNKGTAGIYQTVVNSVKLFTKRDQIRAIEITAKFLQDYEIYLKDEGLTGTGINLYMRTLRALFYAIRERYNDEDKGEIRIPHNPFKKYKITSAPTTDKRALDIKQIKKIRDVKMTLKRDILAQDIFMLSFYLVGMNTVDMYEVESIGKTRIAYNRTKTSSRRQDNAFISIKLEPEAKQIIDKYRDKTGKKVFNFFHTYSEPRSFNKAVNKGLKNIGKHKDVKIDNLTFYAARHSWATIARNDCKITKDDVHEALNHADPGMKVTDIYIKKDWSVIDRANRKVLDKIR